jgi:[NiFe] hydrogenase diaphorase moiety small subunit
MSNKRIDALSPGTFTLDGKDIEFGPGDTLMQAVTRAGGYIPHLCWMENFLPHGSCRLCTVKVNGRMGAACTVLASTGQNVESNTEELRTLRRTLLQMLFVEGNHFCPSCEKSGNCRLQATAYEAGMTGPHFEEFYPNRPVDASHPEVWLDLNRCILCELCVRASRDVDGKNVFAISGHGIDAHLVVNSLSGLLGDSAIAVSDRAVHICPVGALLPKRQGFTVPIGQRRFDLHLVSASEGNAS